METPAKTLAFPLEVSPGQAESLNMLQALFAESCNYLAPQVRSARCWNRVALHHLVYRELRARFPQLGSQMACNAIYSVCRAARIVYQHPQSPWNIGRHPSDDLPLLHFLADSPVYFDRHTLSLRDDRLSMFTLDGRMHFRIDLSQEVVKRFREDKLREISLMRRGEAYVLRFRFGDAEVSPFPALPAGKILPEYLIVEPGRSAAPPPMAPLPERKLA